MKKNIVAILSIFFVLIVVLLVGVVLGIEYHALQEQKETFKGELIKGLEKGEEYIPILDHEMAVVNVVEKNSPAVVNIVASKYVTTRRFGIEEFFFGIEEDYEEELRRRIETGEGTGFLISSNGMIVTNRHVVGDENAEYKVFLSDGKAYDAEVLARDPVQDLAVIKIEGSNFPTVTLGDSDGIQIGQTAVAIGNALGEFQNTVSVGVISGVGRRIIAQGGAMMEVLDDVIQTDAAINLGNSGGPLLNLNGEVIGINTATAVRAEGIGFALPINKAKRAIEGVLSEGKIVYPFLGVRYVMVDENISNENNLSVDYGALLVSGGRGQGAVEPGTAAQKAGLQEEDVILEINGEILSVDNPLGKVIMEHYPGDRVNLLVLREDREISIVVTLGKM